MFEILEFIVTIIQIIFKACSSILFSIWVALPFGAWLILFAIFIITGIILLIYFYVIKKKNNEDPNMPHTINQSYPTTTSMF